MQVQKDGYGAFGNLSKTYDAIRPEMPAQILGVLFSHLKKQPAILDVGCGTGIITRQLVHRGAIVTGTDVDARMIEEAHKHDGKIDYLVAPAEKLPFPDSTFDAVTAFSSFHWFANAQALGEIKRVLKNGGYLFVANRNQVGDLRKEYLQILKSFIEGTLPDAKKNYEPENLLRNMGLESVVEKKFPIIEYLSVEHALAYVRSTSLWNLVPESRKVEAAGALQEFFEDHAIDGLVQRPIEIQTIIGQKPR